MARNKGNATGYDEPVLVRPPKQKPPLDARRPPEPMRPAPALRPGVTLLAIQARRRRYRIG